MSTRLKLMPVLIMLIAGAATSIITFLLHYDTHKAMWILLGVLIFFYILGIILQKIVYHFEKQIAEEEARIAEEEGKVVEKENSAGTEDGELPEGSHDGDASEQSQTEE